MILIKRDQVLKPKRAKRNTKPSGQLWDVVTPGLNGRPDVVLKSFKSEVAARRWAENKTYQDRRRGVMRFVYAKKRNGKRKTLPKRPKVAKRRKNPSEMDKAYEMIRINFPRMSPSTFEKDILANRRKGESIKKTALRLVRSVLPKGKRR